MSFGGENYNGSLCAVMHTDDGGGKPERVVVDKRTMR